MLICSVLPPMQRLHQIEIKRKLEEFARRERVHKIKVHHLHLNTALLPYDMTNDMTHKKPTHDVNPY